MGGVAPDDDDEAGAAPDDARAGTSLTPVGDPDSDLDAEVAEIVDEVLEQVGDDGKRLSAVVRLLEQEFEEYYYESDVIHPSIAEAMERVHPGFMATWMSEWEATGAHNRKQQDDAAGRAFTSHTVGQIFALIVALGGMTAAVIAVAKGNTAAAIAFFSTTLVAMVIAFLRKNDS
jgi:hypothetical protein